jgi:transposase
MASCREDMLAGSEDSVDGFERFTAQFARTLRRDSEAVKLSMTTPWSNGPIEGQINRLKAIKRQDLGLSQLLAHRSAIAGHRAPPPH